MKLIALIMVLFVSVSSEAQSTSPITLGCEVWDGRIFYTPECQRQLNIQAQQEAEARERAQRSEEYAQIALNQLISDHYIDTATVARAYSKGYTTLQIVEEASRYKVAYDSFAASHPGVRFTCVSTAVSNPWVCTAVK